MPKLTTYKCTQRSKSINVIQTDAKVDNYTPLPTDTQPQTGIWTSKLANK